LSETLSYKIGAGGEEGVVEVEVEAVVEEGGEMMLAKRCCISGELGRKAGDELDGSHTVFFIFAGAIFVQNNCLIGTLGKSSGSVMSY
jgi:hypothetical protein